MINIGFDGQMWKHFDSPRGKEESEKPRKPFLKCRFLLRRNLAVHKDKWCRGSDVVKENVGEQSEEKLFSKSRVSWITTQSVRSDALDEELLSSEMILKMKKLIIFPMMILFGSMSDGKHGLRHQNLTGPYL